MRDRSASGFGGDQYRRHRAGRGALAIFVGIGLVCGMIAWGISAHDPYWKLYDTGARPAPVYQPAANEATATVAVATVIGNPDQAAVSPAEAPQDPSLAALEQAAEQPKAPSPRLASISPMNDGAASQWPGQAGATALAQPGLIEPAAFAQGSPASATGLDGTAPSPVMVPEAPAQPRIVATAETEDAMHLSRSARATIQTRLALAGFDPRGADGVFGDNTRRAIADFETAWGFPATGYLEPAVYAELNRRTDAAYEAMRARAVASAMPVQRPAQTEVAEADGSCARRANGLIIPGQSLGCDMAGFAQHFATMGRTMIGLNGDGTDPSDVLGPSNTTFASLPDTR